MNKKTKRYRVFFLLIFVVVFFISGCKKEENESAIVDADGNVYHSIVIGNQTWMVENLRTTKYRDGSSIANITDSAQWENYEFGAYCNYDNLKANGNMLGRLYNWVAANSGVLAPVGWHVPSKAEWDTLINYLGGADVAGEKLKGPYSYSWNQFFDKSLSSGFNAIPCGLRGFHAGTYDFINLSTFWWTTTEESAHWAWYIGVYNYTPAIGENCFFKTLGLSVRCIKD